MAHVFTTLTEAQRILLNAVFRPQIVHAQGFYHGPRHDSNLWATLEIKVNGDEKIPGPQGWHSSGINFHSFHQAMIKKNLGDLRPMMIAIVTKHGIEGYDQPQLHHDLHMLSRLNRKAIFSHEGKWAFREGNELIFVDQEKTHALRKVDPQAALQLLMNAANAFSEKAQENSLVEQITQ